MTLKFLNDYNIYQQLTFLYLAFAYQTDFQLTDEERKVIEQKIKGWYAWEHNSDFMSDFDEATNWYSTTLYQDPAELMPTVMAIVSNLGKALTDMDTKQRIYRELCEISQADGEVKEREKQWLSGLYNDLGLEK